MSLINDALKKAQKQRTGEAPTLASMPSVGGESPQRIARRAKPAGFHTLMVRAGIGGAVVLVLAVGGYFLLRDKPASGGPVSAPAVSGQIAQAPSTPQSNPQVSGFSSQVSVQPPAAAPTFTLPVAPPSSSPAPGGPVSAPAGPLPSVAKQTTASNPQVSLPGDRPGQTPASNPQVSGFRSQVSEPAKPAPKLSPHAIQFIDNIKVAGIRASATDAKVLMNDRVYRVGSIVDADLGLKLVEIAAGALTFEDERGGRYTRTF